MNFPRPITITGKGGNTFTVDGWTVNWLITGSVYFRAALAGEFLESVTRHFDIDDVPPPEIYLLLGSVALGWRITARGIL